MKNFSIKKFTIYVFLAGAGLMLVSILMGMHADNFRKKAILTKGTVVALSSSSNINSPRSPGSPIRETTYTHRPIVRFVTQDGKAIEFLSDTGSKKAAYKKGDAVEVLYLPSSPEKAKINDFLSLWMMPMVIGGIGLVFIVLGGGIIIISKLKGRQNAYLKTNGVPIETDFQRIEKNKDLNLGGKNPYRVITQWTDPSTSKTHTFESDNLWYDPTDQIDKNKITVFIELNNPGKYYIDLTFLTGEKQ